MKSSSVPTKFPIPWGNSAGAGYIRPIPTASQIGIQNGAASLTDGFPPLTFLATAAGGVPPFGQDANGILNQATKWTQWQQAGGPLFWDATFSADIGGYPQGAVVQSNSTLGLFWLCTVDDNTTNPDSGGAGWQALPRLPGSQTWTGTNIFSGEIEANGAGTGLSVAGNATVGGTLGAGATSVSSLSATSNVTIAGTASFASSALGGQFYATNVGSNALLNFLSNYYWEANAGAGTLTGNVPNCNIVLSTDGTASIATNLTVDNLIQGTYARLTDGATGSGDGDRVTNLNDFPLSTGTNGYEKLPNGRILQWGQTLTSASGGVTFSFPVTYPNAFLGAQVSFIYGSSTSPIWPQWKPINNGSIQVAALISGGGFVAVDVSVWAVGY